MSTYVNRVNHLQWALRSVGSIDVIIVIERDLPLFLLGTGFLDMLPRLRRAVLVVFLHVLQCALVACAGPELGQRSGLLRILRFQNQPFSIPFRAHWLILCGLLLHFLELLPELVKAWLSPEQLRGPAQM